MASSPTPKEDTAFPLENATDWAGATMRWERDRIRLDLRCSGPPRRERKRVVAAQYTGESPGRILDDSEVRVSRRGQGMEQSVVFSAIRRHHERALGAHCLLQSSEQAYGSACDRSRGAIRTLCQHHIARPDSEGRDLTCNVRPRPRALGRPMRRLLASRLGPTRCVQAAVCQYLPCLQATLAGGAQQATRIMRSPQSPLTRRPPRATCPGRPRRTWNTHPSCPCPSVARSRVSLRLSALNCSRLGQHGSCR